MIALDTCVLVRLITRDNPNQARRAAEVMRSGALWLSKTVLLELVWVLSYTYRFDRAGIALAVCRLLGLERLQLEDAACMTSAVRCYEQGMDFADALHLASAERAAELITFDSKLAVKARQISGTIPVRLLEAR